MSFSLRACITAPTDLSSSSKHPKASNSIVQKVISLPSNAVTCKPTCKSSPFVMLDVIVGFIHVGVSRNFHSNFVSSRVSGQMREIQIQGLRRIVVFDYFFCLMSEEPRRVGFFIDPISFVVKMEIVAVKIFNFFTNLLIIIKRKGHRPTI